jgi:type I restriction enzyme S subunit
VNEFYLKKGDLVFARTGASVGNSYLYDPKDGPLVFAGYLIRVTPSPSKLHPLFLRYCVQSKRYWDWVEKMSIRSGQPGINGKEYGMLLVPLPPLKEQRAIAEALSDVDGLLAALEELIAKKQAIKQATMQQLLTGQTRLPGFSGKWEMKKISEVATYCNEKNSLAEDLPVLTCSKHLGFVDSLSYFKNQIFSKDLSGYKIIRRGQIGYPANHIEEGSIGLQDIYDIALVSPIYVVCSPKEGINSYFLHRLLKLDRYRQKFAIATTSSVDRRGSLRWPTFSELVVNLPYIDEQEAIAAILSDMDAEIAALERRRDKARAIRQGMMQQLLTGRIRLIQPETTAEKLAVTRPVGRKHNWQFNEAVVISVLAKHFGNEQYPLGRMRYTKLSYLLHRHKEGHAEGYIKKAAGPYNPQTRYGGPEKIALQKDYVRQHRSGKGQGFIASTNFDEAVGYFDRWYESEALQWLEQFRYKTNNDLELLTTVDMAVEELCEAGEEVSVESVKDVIRSNPEWKPKLDRSIFSDANLARAIEDCQKLFDY